MTAVRLPLQIRVALTMLVVVTVGVIVLGSGSHGSVPITTRTLERAARLAQSDQFGYDYACAVFQAPRQLRCDGQGPSVLFLVDAAGVPRLEPGQG